MQHTSILKTAGFAPNALPLTNFRPAAVCGFQVMR